LSHADRQEDENIEGALVRAVRKSAEKLWRKRPLVDVTVLRL
jgi:ribonuclease J